MCLAIPGKIINIEGEDPLSTSGKVEFGGIFKEVSLAYVPEAKMWHKVSHSTGSAQFTYIWARSKMRLYRKHTRGFHQMSLILYAFLHGAIRAIFPRQDNMRIHTYPRAYLRGLLNGLKTKTESRI